jgi:uncharacterized protein YjiS (DUF1127 family)
MLMSLVLTRLQAWLAYRATIQELQCLSEKELLDLGIVRSEIKDLARRAVQ